MEQHCPHISICVCTFRRPALLSRLVHELARQKTEGLFTYSVVVADNDASRSSEKAMQQLQNDLPLDLSYCVEPRQNIALARNMALANAQGNLLAFIDDDELPGQDWLLQLFQAREAHNADGVLGPVLPRFERQPPAWVTRGRFCDRPVHDTGFIIDWTEGRTGNLLLRREILDGLEPVFLPEFGSGGEDRDLFRRMIERGHVFIWCNEAAVDEWVPPSRCKRTFMIRRALLRGKMSSNQPVQMQDLTKSLIALVGYTLALPVLLLIGQHFFMKYLIKICDHAGKLLAFVGLNPIRENYISE